VLYQCFFTVYAKKTFHFLFTIVGGKSACPAVRHAALAPELTTYMQRCVRSVHYDGWRQMLGQCVGAGHPPLTFILRSTGGKWMKRLPLGQLFQQEL